MSESSTAVPLTPVLNTGEVNVLFVNVWLPVNVATVESISSVRSPLEPPPDNPVPATTPVTSPDKSLSITNVPAPSLYVTVILEPPVTNTFTWSSTASAKSVTWSAVIAIA